MSQLFTIFWGPVMSWTVCANVAEKSIQFSACRRSSPYMEDLNLPTMNNSLRASDVGSILGASDVAATPGATMTGPSLSDLIMKMVYLWDVLNNCPEQFMQMWLKNNYSSLLVGDPPHIWNIKISPVFAFFWGPVMSWTVCANVVEN